MKFLLGQDLNIHLIYDIKEILIDYKQIIWI